MPTLTIIRGLPGSGKSTLARKLAEETGAIHIEPDMFCMQDGEYKYDPEKYGKAFDNARAIISRLAYNMECDIIFADVLPQTAQVDSFRYLIPSNYKRVVRDLHISKEESLKRNKHNVRPEDIENMAAAWQSWRRGETVTDCNQLPKLTAEVFDRPYCPEWAKYAAVDENGKAYYFTNKPKCYSAGYFRDLGWDAGDFMLIGDFDSSDWQNSLIQRPKKSKKQKTPESVPLPDWVEVGAYAYFDRRYHQITSISTNGQTPVVSFDTGEHFPFGGIRFDKVKEARLVPWTDDLSFCVGKAFKYKGVTMLCLASRGDCLSFVGGNEYKAKDLLEKGFTFADGSPCGEFEHLEYDPIDECFDWEN